MTTHRADMSNNAAALLHDLIKASGLREEAGARYDGTHLEGTLDQWAALGDATVALYQRSRGANKRILLASARRNPALRALAFGFFAARRGMRHGSAA